MQADNLLLKEKGSSQGLSIFFADAFWPIFTKHGSYMDDFDGRNFSVDDHALKKGSNFQRPTQNISLLLINHYNKQ